MLRVGSDVFVQQKRGVKTMKRKFCVAVVCMCLSIGAAAYAAVGDIADTLYNTDIITYLDGKQIKGYSLDGRMMICLEDLRNYGYAVEYDDSIRTLFVTKDGDISEDFNPYFERGTIGGIAGYTYETDIVAYVNGVYVDTENIGGRLVAVAEDLANVAEEDNPNKEFGTSKYFMSHSYDDATRTLNVYSLSGSGLNANQMLDNLNNMKTPYGQEFYAARVQKAYPIYDGGYLVYVNQSSSHGYNSSLYMLKNSGEYINLNNVLRQYKLVTERGKLNIADEENGLSVSKDGTSVSFLDNDNNKHCLDLKSLVIY